MKRNTRLLFAVALAIVAALLGALLSRALVGVSTGSPPQLAKATWIEPPRPVPAVPLIDDQGRADALDRLRGGWHLVFFGFTNCPDVCPNTLTILARVEKALADLPESQQPGVVLVSIDPTRDTPEQLGPYVKFFGERFVGITGTEENIAALTSALGVPVAKVDLEGGYTMDHGAGIFVLDPEVRVRAFFSTPHEVATIASDYRRIVSG